VFSVCWRLGWRSVRLSASTPPHRAPLVWAKTRKLPGPRRPTPQMRATSKNPVVPPRIRRTLAWPFASQEHVSGCWEGLSLHIGSMEPYFRTFSCSLFVLLLPLSIPVFSIYLRHLPPIVAALSSPSLYGCSLSCTLLRFSRFSLHTGHRCPSSSSPRPLFLFHSVTLLAWYVECSYRNPLAWPRKRQAIEPTFPFSFHFRVFRPRPTA